MTPMLGIMASAISGNLSSPAYESIDTTTVGVAGSSTITFSSISGTYQHLQLRFIAAASTSLPTMYLRLNSDTGANYVRHRLQGNGTSASSGVNTGETATYMFGSAGISTAPIFRASVLDIVDYSNTNKYKTMRTLSGDDLNGLVAGYGGYAVLSSGLWRSTSAITSVSIVINTGASFTQYSSFALYGIKG
jgi:hypothetical protein